MKRLHIFPVLGMIIGLVSLLFSCEQTTEDTGHLVFHTYLENYLRTEGISFQIDVDHSTREVSQSETKNFNENSYGYAYMPNVVPGIYNLTVSFYDTGELLGATEGLTVEVIPTETISTTITGFYDDGRLMFRVSSETTEVKSTVDIEKYDAVIVAKMESASSEPHVTTEAFVQGTLTDAEFVSLEFPDGFVASVQSKGLDGNCYLNVYDNGIHAERHEYYETGTVTLKIEDRFGALVTAVDELMVGEDEHFMPVIDNPSDGQDISGGDTVEWQSDLSQNVETIVVYIVNGTDTSSLVWYDIIEDPFSTFSTFVPGGETGTGDTYYLTVMAVDQEINANLFSGLNNYSYDDIEHELVENAEVNLSGIAFHSIVVY